MAYKGTNHKGGRPKGAVSKATEIAIKVKEKMANAFYKRFSPILESQMDAAEGIKTEAYDKKTGDLYYKDPGPDVQAFKTILEQVAGKPKETVEMNNKVTVEFNE